MCISEGNKLIGTQKSSLQPHCFRCVLCTQTARNSVCELCSLRYVRVCIHVHKHFNRNEELCSHCSECVCVLCPRHSVQYVNVAYFRVFYRTLFLRNFFMADFIYSQSSCQKFAKRNSSNEYFWIWVQIQEFLVQ